MATEAVILKTTVVLLRCNSRTTQYTHFQHTVRDWSNGPGVQSPRYSSRGPRFSSQNPHCGSQPPVTPFQGINFLQISEEKESEWETKANMLHGISYMKTGIGNSIRDRKQISCCLGLIWGEVGKYVLREQRKHPKTNCANEYTTV